MIVCKDMGAMSSFIVTMHRTNIFDNFVKNINVVHRKNVLHEKEKKRNEMFFYRHTHPQMHTHCDCTIRARYFAVKVDMETMNGTQQVETLSNESFNVQCVNMHSSSLLEIIKIHVSVIKDIVKRQSL
ncbi:hypothetical protein COCON_G00175710, partial [Conger conger]